LLVLAMVTAAMMAAVLLVEAIAMKMQQRGQTCGSRVLEVGVNVE
jgi:hypothetical protein